MTVQLRRVTRLAYGASLADSHRREGGVVVFGSNGPVGFHDVPNTRRPVIVIGRKGSFGKVQYSAEPVFAIDTTFFVDSTQTDADIRWLYYALQTLRLDELSEDVGVPGLSREKAYEQRLAVPSLVEQRAIADYLDRETAQIDALIASRARLSALLDERVGVAFDTAMEEVGFRMPTRLFDPVLAEGDFRVARLSQVLVQLTNGYVGPTRDILVDDGIRYVQSLHIKDGRIDFDRGHYFVTPEWHNERPRIHLRDGDVLIVQTGDIGQVAVVPPGFGEASCHALQIARVRRSMLSGPYLAAHLRSPFGRASLLSRATGALHPHLEAGIKDIPVVVPPQHIQDRVVQRVEAVQRDTRIIRSRIERQVALLEEKRQALIAVAVTGGIEIPVAA